MNERGESRWPSHWGAEQDSVRLPKLSVAALPDEEDWRHKAACQGEETDAFFPLGSSLEALMETRWAKAVCARCPVRSECLEFALATDQRYGVWGGLSEDERREMGRTS